MALACDLRLASPNATLGLAETKWAIIPGAGGTVRLPRAVPLGVAMEMILTGEPIDAAEAYRLGLVNRIVPLPQLRAEALRVADRHFLAVMRSEDAVEGSTAFAEKRPPRYRGR